MELPKTPLNHIYLVITNVNKNQIFDVTATYFVEIVLKEFIKIKYLNNQNDLKQSYHSKYKKYKMLYNTNLFVSASIKLVSYQSQTHPYNIDF